MYIVGCMLTLVTPVLYKLMEAILSEWIQVYVCFLHIFSFGVFPSQHCVAFPFCVYHLTVPIPYQLLRLLKHTLELGKI